MPAEPHETCAHVFAERQFGLAFNRDLVVVVDPAEVGQFEVTGQRGGLAADAFHHVAVAAQHVNVGVEQIESGTVVRAASHCCDRHPDTVAEPLAQRPGCRFDAGRFAEFRVAGTRAFRFQQTFASNDIEG